MKYTIIYTRLYPWLLCLLLALLVHTDVWITGGPYLVDSPSFFETFTDRANFQQPLTYSIWLGVFKTLGWPNGAMFFQAWIAMMLLWLATHYYVRARYRLGLLITLGLVLYFASGFPFVINTLSPDAFTGIALLSFVLLIAPSSGKGPFDRIVVTIVFLLSSSMQHGHSFLFLGLMVLLSVWAIISSREIIAVKYLGLGWGLVLAAMIVLPSMHAVLGHGFKTSAATHLYLMSRMAETELLEKYLDKNCEAKSLSLCKYRHVLPMPAEKFRTDAESPFYLEGGFDNPDLQREYMRIYRSSFKDPELLWLHGRTFFAGGLTQIFSFTPNWISGQEYAPAFRFILWVRWLLERLFVLLAVIIVTVWMLNKHKKLSKSGLFVSLLILGLLGNAFIEAYLSGVDALLQAKVMWLLPAVSLILVLAYLVPEPEPDVDVKPVSDE